MTRHKRRFNLEDLQALILRPGVLRQETLDDALLNWDVAESHPTTKKESTAASQDKNR